MKTKTLNRIASAVVSAAMLISSVPQLFANAFVWEDPIIDYLVIGDGISSGFGLESDAQCFANIVTGDLTIALDNQAVLGTSSSEMYELVSGGSLDENIADAEIITITCGLNDIFDLLYAYAATLYNTRNNIVGRLELDAASFEALLYRDPDAMMLYLVAAAEDFSEASVLESALNSFYRNLADTKDYIGSVNSEAIVVVCTQYNPYTELAWSQYAPLVDISSELDAAVSSLNTLIVNNALGYGWKVADVYTAFEDAESIVTYPVYDSDAGTVVSFSIYPNYLGHELIAETVEAVIKETAKEGTITLSNELVEQSAAGLGWTKINNILVLQEGYTFSWIEGESCQVNMVLNKGTITGGQFAKMVSNNGEITGGTFKFVGNLEDAVISDAVITGSVLNKGTITGNSDISLAKLEDDGGTYGPNVIMPTISIVYNITFSGTEPVNLVIIRTEDDIAKDYVYTSTSGSFDDVRPYRTVRSAVNTPYTLEDIEHGITVNPLNRYEITVAQSEDDEYVYNITVSPCDHETDANGECTKCGAAFEVSGTTGGYSYDVANGVVNINSAGTYTIRNIDESVAVDHRIVVADGAAVVRIELDGVNIECWEPMDIGSRAMVDITLMNYSENHLAAEGDGCAIHVSDASRFSIDCQTYHKECDDKCGSIFATGSGYCAGIGGHGEESVSAFIAIFGGNVYASAEEGAGIGGGADGNAENIRIYKGNVTATSEFGQGVGSGESGSASIVTVSPDNSAITVRTGDVSAVPLTFFKESDISDVLGSRFESKSLKLYSELAEDTESFVNAGYYWVISGVLKKIHIEDFVTTEGNINMDGVDTYGEFDSELDVDITGSGDEAPSVFDLYWTALEADEPTNYFSGRYIFDMSKVDEFFAWRHQGTEITYQNNSHLYEGILYDGNGNGLEVGGYAMKIAQRGDANLDHSIDSKDAAAIARFASASAATSDEVVLLESDDALAKIAGDTNEDGVVDAKDAAATARFAAISSSYAQNVGAAEKYCEVWQEINAS